MKDKEKQIEEMANDIPYLTLSRRVFVSMTEMKNVGWTLSEEDNKVIAEVLIEQSYRKLPEDSVVLSKEEYEKLKNENKTLLYSAKMMVGCFCDQQKLKEQASKETAKKVLKFFANTFPKEKRISSSHVKIHRAIEKISKELKIELKE